LLPWRAPFHMLFTCSDFPDFGHEAKYAPFGMLSKPEIGCQNQRSPLPEEGTD
jgi:hypothetical protein